MVREGSNRELVGLMRLSLSIHLTGRIRNIILYSEEIHSGLDYLMMMEVIKRQALSILLAITGDGV